MKHIGIVKQDDCTGCLACLNACPSNAITIQKEHGDTEYPFVNEMKCTSCGLCQNVCSAVHNGVFREPLNCYAAYRDDDIVQNKCASGGIATTFAEVVCEQNGVVYGSAIVCEDNMLAARHICVTEKKEIWRLSGSKYVQSQIGNTYSEIKSVLKEKKVLFVGTPCQVDGLQHYLEATRGNRDGLITVDLICHGVPPTSYLGEYINSLNFDQIDDVHFFSQDAFTVELFSKKKCVYSAGANTDLYFAAFLNSVIYRENCYTCRYARRKRVSDITIGDFWKINRDSLNKKTHRKISVVLINTERGAAFWEGVKDRFVSEERQYEEAIAGNRQLCSPSPRSKDRKAFYERIEKEHWLKALKETEIYNHVESEKKKKPSIKWYLKNMVKRMVNK